MSIHPSPPPQPGLLVVIPAFNEAASLGGVLARLKASIDADVLVVSDASVDDTARIARAHGVQVIELAQQIGAWGATQAGIRFALARGYDRVASMDADGQHPPESLQRLVDEQARSGADLVIGTFPQRLSGPKRLAWAWFRTITGLGVEDLTSGLRIYARRSIRVLASPQATLLDYQDIGVLLLLRRHGLSLQEVAVTMALRSDGKSRVFSSWFTVARYMAQTTLLCIARIGRLGGRPVALPAETAR